MVIIVLSDLLSSLVFQVPIIPVVFSSYSNFYLRKEKQFNSGNALLDYFFSQAVLLNLSLHAESFSVFREHL